MDCDRCCGASPSILSRVLRSEKQHDHRRRHRRYRAHQVIFDEDYPLDSLHCIHSGRVKLYKQGQNEEEVILQLAGPGSLIGYIPLLDGLPHCTSAETLTPVETCAFNGVEFRALMRRHPALTEWLVRGLTADVRSAHQEIVARSCLPAVARVARLLLAFLDDAGGSGPQGLLRIELKRWEIAQMVGSTPETVSRVLRCLHDAGILILDRTTICVQDLGQLRQRASCPEGTLPGDHSIAS